MCENVITSCYCEQGYDKGAIKKTIENNIFTVFGNIIKDNTIIIKYHGLLMEDNVDITNNLNISFFFDNLESDKKTIRLARCTKCLGECYCAVIDLNHHDKISFSFNNGNGKNELNNEKPFSLAIEKDPIASIMERYGFEANKELPVSMENKEEKLSSFKTIVLNIRSFFNKMLPKKLEKNI